MAPIPSKIFKKYDIRGQALDDGAVITQTVARQIGHAFGTYVQRVEDKQQIIVGRDNRLSSFDLAEAVIDGILLSGCDAVDIGLVSTPLVYWHAVHRGDVGGLMVTGSHLPPDQNGFKLSIGKRNLFGDQITMLRTLIERDQLAYGEGRATTDEKSYSTYIHDLTGRLTMARPLKVVIDAGNGTGGLFAPMLFRRWGHDVVECLFCEPDGHYPNHQPDPQQPENIAFLSERVRALGADVGIAFDGDADRMGAVDEKGQQVVADRILALLAQDMLKRHPGAAVVADVLSSQALFDAVAHAGGKPEMWISGHSLIKARMAELEALLGGEMSGHIFLGEDYFGFDDGYFAAGRLLQLLAASDAPLSALDAALPHYYNTPEYRPHCADDAKEMVINGVKAALQDKGRVVDVDGVRIQFEKGWGLLRASNTEPVLSLRFEGQTEADALAYRDLFLGALSQYPQVEPVTV
ncbi:MAG: phosphomannomutase/phosphoglucomutase [Anaerolineaceae bacterium]|nr:phosphomannomutase/phosphoglucomutase [Anaerolineaceae bacterium]